ncbi:MAG: M1 family metallopeptidase [Chitinophagales bacterium]|nr:M1 family metallopeptidase [Chitinophagales bacterium]MDW8419019.1 M1 family metallopeptidase [Chitinophagales bacterium]
MCFSTVRAYWQQQTDYEIDVTLNDTLHELSCFMTLRYTNHSPDTLRQLYFHLWPNAYRNHQTAYARQALENGSTAFHYSKPSQRGGIDGINFKVNGEQCRWYCTDKSMEICVLILNEPLLPGGSVSITTPFRVTLPETFSRLGHEGQSYQISQWYPKPAVYDKNGWHTFPYLDQGEFYSEFGSFRVAITLPKNYRVAATGDLQNAEELAWLDSLNRATRNLSRFGKDLSFPPSSPEKKTLRFVQHQVHDFAWFADKRYHVLKGEVVLPVSKRSVTTWAMFTNNKPQYWIKADSFIAEAVLHYSRLVGEYPYGQVSAVEGALRAGGGMEYPNVTVIGDVNSAYDLDIIIAHEVGHNWFYGILGTNERDHPWLDEGINSYYEYRYAAARYPVHGLFGKLPAGIARFFDLHRYTHKDLYDIAYQTVARNYEDQPCHLHAARYTALNYAVIVYGKTMLAFQYLEKYLGTELFDSIMKNYYDTWKFRHPSPADLRVLFERMSGKNLGWFFDELLATTRKTDYAVTRFRRRQGGEYQITIQNKGEIQSPVFAALVRRDSVMQTFVLDGFAAKEELQVMAKPGDKFVIDPERSMPEIYRCNNTITLRRLAPRLEKIRLQFLGSLENPYRTQLFFTPYLGYNHYDKLQVGIALYNTTLPSKKFTYFLAPAYGTASRRFIGTGRLAYQFFPNRGIHKISVGIHGKRYSYIREPDIATYNKIEPYVQFFYRPTDPRSPYRQSLLLRSVHVWLQRMRNDGSKTPYYYYVNELRYTIARGTAIHPFEINLSAQQGDRFLGLFAEGKFTVSYPGRNQGLFIRLFSGGFPYYDKNPSDVSPPLPRVYLSMVTAPNFAHWLQRDYMFDETFLDRNGASRTLARQVALTGGAFRSLTTFGATSVNLTAINLSSSVHRFVPVRPFLNGAVLVQQSHKKFQTAAEAGVSLALWPGAAELHLPLIVSKNIRENQLVLGVRKWYQRITFTLRLPAQQPLDLLRQFL